MPDKALRKRRTNRVFKSLHKPLTNPAYVFLRKARNIAANYAKKRVPAKQKSPATAAMRRARSEIGRQIDPSRVEIED